MPYTETKSLHESASPKSIYRSISLSNSVDYLELALLDDITHLKSAFTDHADSKDSKDKDGSRGWRYLYERCRDY